MVLEPCSMLAFRSLVAVQDVLRTGQDADVLPVALQLGAQSLDVHGKLLVQVVRAADVA
jgi:hypothetical protein